MTKNELGYGVFLNNLDRHNNGLRKKIEEWQDSIKKGDNQLEELTPSQRNIYEWYKSSKLSYHSKKYKLTPGKEEVLKSFREDPNYIFKNIVEVIGREIFSICYTKELEKLSSENDVKLEVFTTSDSDDVFAGVDIILKIEINGKKTYTGIDIAVSDSKNYILEKLEKNQNAICIEFNMYERQPYNMQIPRYVLQFSPKLIAEILGKYLESIERGEQLDAHKLYIDAKSKNVGKQVLKTKARINNLINI